MRTLLNRFALAALICCGMFLIHSTVWAQSPPCPDSTGPAPNPAIIPWIAYGPVYEKIPGTDCYVTYQVCWRSTGLDSAQAWVDEIIPDSSSACDSISNSQLILDVGSMADSLVAAQLHVPFCGSDSFVSTSVYLAQCWSAQGIARINEQKSWGLFPCISSAECVKTCKWCADYFTGPIRQVCYTSNSATSVICGPWAPPGPWNWNVCYTLGCFWPVMKPTTLQSPIPIDQSLHLYPNPTVGSLTIESSESGTNIDILNVLGQNVLSGVMPKGGKLTLDISSLPNGVYYVSEGQTEIRFIKH